VVVIPLDQGGRFGETLDWLQLLWDNFYLRNGVLFDEDGAIGLQYDQPQTGLPFGRGFIIDRDGTVDLPYFGYYPSMVIDRIYELLGTTDVPRGESWSGIHTRLLPNIPNPFREATTIHYRLSAPAQVSLEIFDLSGRLVRRLSDGVSRDPGLHESIWDGRDRSGGISAPGIYYCRLKTDEFIESQKLILLR
jgi:hypothetical protein